ncbi:MAG: endonuclease/exonuclease/phosphatase family protein [Treponema sp.]|nr:endonuclease/exonuclease/phosphatase family protein [Treponema sp.]MCL2271520.1 endonuclease/exonuclease/phosphatase family protein [Treponema sp.]
MKKLFYGWLVFLPVVTAVFAGCSFAEVKDEAEAEGSVVLMTWNVHNLFDGEDNGSEYSEYTKSSGWSEEKYLGRLNSITAAFNSIEPVPDIILLQEIESLKVFEALSLSLPNGYSWSHFANNPDAALGLGILSRLPLTDAKVHSITTGGDTTPRPVLETRIETNEGSFVIFACHWKSKLGGDDITENVRRASARVILRRIRELWKNEGELGIIVAGDLNENHDEFFRQGSEAVCALLPDDPYCALITGFSQEDTGDAAALQKDFIVISKNKPPSPVNFPNDAVVLYSPWVSELENGSYYYKHNWETIDHFLVSNQFFGKTGLKYDRTNIVNNQYFTNSGGIPVAYNERTGSGLSDHLPLLLVLKTGM